MGAVATMIVRIGADVTDLTKGMDAATKAVATASTRIAQLGKSMTLFVTAPAVIAAYEFAKLAASADTLGDRLERVFGDKTANMKSFIADMRQTVPESTMSLEKMAVEVQNLALNMGMSRDKAFDMSEGLLKMAADAAAFAHIPMADALEGLEKGLAGKTRGLIQFGMVINQASIKQEAFRLGLMNTGKALTPLGTAIAAWSLMQQQASRITGEAARISGQESVRFDQLKANFIDMAVKIGTRVMPAVMLFVDGLNSLMNGLDRISPKIVTVGLVLLGIAAAAGPILSIVAGIGKLIVVVRGLIAVATASSGIMEFLAALTAPEIVLAIAAIAAAITAVVYAIKKLKGESKKTPGTATTSNPMGTAGVGNGATSFDPETQGTAFDQLEKKAQAIAAEFQYAQQRGNSLLGFYAAAARAQEKLTGYAKTGADAVKAKAIAAMRSLQGVLDEKTFQKLGLGKETGQLFGLPAMDVLTRMAEKGDNLASAFENTVKQGGDLSGVFTEAFREATMLEDLIDAQPNKFGEIAVAAGKAYEKLRPLMMAGEMMGFSGETHRDSGGGHAFNAKAQAAYQFGQDTESYNRGLAVREEMLKLPPVFNAVREAALGLAEGHRQIVNQLHVDIANFRNLGAQTQALADTMLAGIDSILKLVSAASVGQKVADKIVGKVDQAITGMVDRAFSYIGNAIGSLFGKGKHKTGKGTPLDALIEGMNYASTKIASSAGLKAIEAQIKLQLRGNLSLAQRIAAEAKLAQVEQALGETTNALNESLSNVPSGYKIALARFNATNGISTSAQALRTGGTTGGDTHINGNVYIQAGSKSLKELFAELALMQRRDNKRGGSSPFATAIAGA